MAAAPPAGVHARGWGTFRPGRVHRGGRVTPVVDVTDDHPARAHPLPVDRDTTTPPAMAPAPVSALRSADVADLLELLADANSALAAELKAIAGSRRSLSQATVTRLERLLVQMRPAARVRQVLAGLDPQVLLAGAREWHRRTTGTGRPR